MMEFSETALHIEALIFASDKPLSVPELTELVNTTFGFLEESFTADRVSECIQTIFFKYASSEYPFQIKETGGGWQFLTKPVYYKTVARLNGEKFLKRLSTAALETLSVVAYKQPVTKGEIEAIRGVNSDYSIQKLLEKELIIITGRSEDLPGKPLLYATSRTFMDYFGINNVTDLPKIKEVLAEQQTEPTIVKEEKTGTDESIAVNTDGNLTGIFSNEDENEPETKDKNTNA